MKTFGKIIICIIVVLAAIGIAYLVYDKQETGGNTLTNTSNSSNKNTLNNTTNNTEQKEENDTIDHNTEYVGQEENKEEIQEDVEQENKEEQPKEELTGKDKAINIVKNKYALDGQTVRFDHMEGSDYVLKMNDGTAVTWYLVDGETWEAEEY